jgi:hypothetical protein
LVDGSGNCIEMEDGLVAIGSGGLYAQSAATAMLDNDLLSADEIAIKAMRIAGDLCVYTNYTTVMEILVKEMPSTLHLRQPSEGIKQLLVYAGESFIESQEDVLL